MAESIRRSPPAAHAGLMRSPESNRRLAPEKLPASSVWPSNGSWSTGTRSGIADHHQIFAWPARIGQVVAPILGATRAEGRLAFASLFRIARAGDAAGGGIAHELDRRARGVEGSDELLDDACGVGGRRTDDRRRI